MTRSAGSPAAAQIISTAGLYGAERVLLDLAIELRDSGWRSDIAILPSPGAATLTEAARDQGLRAFVLPSASMWCRDLLACISASTGLPAPSVVHGHGYRADVLLAWSANPDGARRIATCHNWIGSNAKMRFYRWLDKQALRRLDHAAAVSPDLLAEIRRAGVRESRSSLVLNGIDLTTPRAENVERVRADLSKGPDIRIILSIARLDHIKGTHVLVDALARLVDGPPWTLVVVGDGEERGHLEAQVRRAGLAGRVAFVGFRDRDDVAAFHAIADVSVVSSLDEGLPLVVLEAMGWGVPVVSTAVGAIPLVIDSGRNGLLVPPEDPAALAAAVEVVLRDPQSARERAAAARRDFDLRFRRSAMGARYLELYSRVLAGKGSG
jgi:glycosyltransferase involved in cell wall biosynthesis